MLAPSSLVVFPRIHDLVAPPGARADQPLDGALHRGEPGRGREEFAALRPYVEGDDLRLVHWASTAKFDELVVRQDEAPHRRSTTVLLDLRHHVHDPASLEAAVSAAASVVAACSARNASARLVTTGDLDVTAGDGDSLRAVLAQLAVAGPGRGRSLVDVASTAGLPVQAGGVVAITTDAAVADDLTALARGVGGTTSTVLVRFGRGRPSRSRQARAPMTPELGQAFDTVVEVPFDEPFPAVWDGAVSWAQERP